MLKWWLDYFHNSLQLQPGGSTLETRTVLEELCEKIQALVNEMKEHQRQTLLVLEFHMKPGLSIR